MFTKARTVIALFFASDRLVTDPLALPGKSLLNIGAPRFELGTSSPPD